MKKLIGAISISALAIACLLFATHTPATRQSASSQVADPTPPTSAPTPPAPQLIPIPETTITLRRELQFPGNENNPALVLPAGTQLISESTQGLEYIVERDGRTLCIHCNAAAEPHGRFTDGRVEHLALQMAQELRAEGKVPTNERIVARASQALEDHRLEGAPADLESEVESLQRVLLLKH